LRATLSEADAERCLTDVPVLPAATGERQVACFHVDAPHPEPTEPTEPTGSTDAADSRDPSEVTT
jgi:hypothetical protein